MITREIKEFPVFAEFDPQAQKYWFDYSRDKVVFHIDTLYYTVSIKDDSNDTENLSMCAFLGRLEELKNQKRSFPNANIMFGDLSVELGSFSFYSMHLSYNENFDIFIASHLPTPQTPRVVVQLRSRALVLDGTMKTVQNSFKFVKCILYEHGFEIEDVRENRIDYAYHTNLLSSPSDYFNKENILEHMKSTMNIGHVHGDIFIVPYDEVFNVRGSKVETSYFSLGNRKSNNVFIRIYNKSQEVVEMNYKSFFFDRWLDKKLINRYDHYVYQRAYICKSYRMGILRGRLEWYLEYGTNESIKKELLKVNESCLQNNSNVKQLEQVVNRYLPPVTLVMNIEFQTKRKFYKDAENYINEWGLVGKNALNYLHDIEDPLQRLASINYLRSKFCDHLTTKTLCFVNDKDLESESVCAWWKKINSCLKSECKKIDGEYYRSREVGLDKKRAERNFLNSVAYLGSLNQGNGENKGFVEDLSDILCSLNDNDIYRDFYGFAPDPVTGREYDISIKQQDEYKSLKKRKNQRIKGIYKKIESEI